MYLNLTVCLRASAINCIPLALASATANKALASPCALLICSCWSASAIHVLKKI